MLRNASRLLFGISACWGLFACAGSVTTPTDDRIALTMSRLDSGDLEYCEEDAAGATDCQTLPYDGDCAVVSQVASSTTCGTSGITPVEKR